MTTSDQAFLSDFKTLSFSAPETSLSTQPELENIWSDEAPLEADITPELPHQSTGQLIAEVEQEILAEQRAEDGGVAEVLATADESLDDPVDQTPEKPKLYSLSPNQKPQTLSQIQDVFSDSQKIAYVGLCFLSLREFKSTRLPSGKAFVKAALSFDQFATTLMEKLYVYLDLLPAEKLAEHGLLPSDLSASLLEDAKEASRRVLEDEEEEAMDIRFQEERNKVEGKRRWMVAGAVTLAGGALIGLTAGLAAPFIGAGIGAALTTFGVAQGVGVGAFMASTGGIALIAGGGVLTGGGNYIKLTKGMSGMSIIRRTRGIEQFQFLGVLDAINRITANKRKRREERLKNVEQEMKDGKLGKELAEMRSEDIAEEKYDVGTGGTVATGVEEVVWEMKVDAGETDVHDAEENLDNWAGKGGGDGDDATMPEMSDPIMEAGKAAKQTSVLITISGWVNYDEDDHTYPYSCLQSGFNGDHYSLIWETKSLQELGSTMSILAREITSFIFQQGLQATILPVLMGALTGPMWLMKLNYLVDNPWGNALTKAEKAGRLLADTLIGQVQSNRPVTLVGFSLGARLIYFCLLELASKGAYGIVETVYMMGTPCVSSRKEWNAITSVVSGTVYNCYTTTDTLLGVLYRASIASYKDVPGLASVGDIPGVKNIDVTETIHGHMDYATLLPQVLENLGFSINSETIVNQDEELIMWKEEYETERLIEREKKEVERTEKMEKQAQDKTEESEKKKLAREMEDENKRFALAEKKRFDEVKLQTLKTAVSLEQIATEELKEMENMESLMNAYWLPREITSTLPPLVITSEDLVQAKELSSTQPPLVVGNGAEAPPVVQEEEYLSDF